MDLELLLNSVPALGSLIATLPPAMNGPPVPLCHCVGSGGSNLPLGATYLSDDINMAGMGIRMPGV